MIQFIIHPHFSLELEHLKRKYPKILSDLEYFQGYFYKESGKHLFESIYKFRLKNTSIPTGSRSGFRIIAIIEGDFVVLISLYSKNEKENISKREIDAIINS